MCFNGRDVAMINNLVSPLGGLSASKAAEDRKCCAEKHLSSWDAALEMSGEAEQYCVNGVMILFN